MKKSLLKLLTVCAISCFCLGVGLLFPSYSTYATDEPAISATADFTTMTKAEIQSAGFTLSNLAMSKNATYGAVPGAAWGGTVSGGNASVIYTLDAGTGYYLKDSELSFSVFGGHRGGVYWYNKSNKLGATLKVYVSSDNENWTEVYDLTNTIKTSGGTTVSNLESPISLSSYLTDTRYGYIKFDIQHWTAAEITENTSLSWSSIALDKIGVRLFKIDITSDIIVSEMAILTTADFTTMEKAEIQSAGFTLSNLAMSKNATFGAVPGAAWGASVSGGNASISYTLDAGLGYKLNASELSFDIGAGHESGRYWYNNAYGTGSHKLGANFTVSVSTDNENWVEIFDLSDLDWVKNHGQKETNHYNNEDSVISLSDYIGVRKIYIRFDIMHFTNTELDALVASDYSAGIPLTEMGLSVFKINIAGMKEKDDSQKDDCRVKTMQILLGGRIDVKFGLVISEEVAANEDAYVSLALGGDEERLSILDLPVNERGYYEITISVAPAQMTEQIEIQVVLGDYVGKEFSYTLREYVVYLIGLDESDEKTAFLKAMLNYGAYAQILFDVNTDNLANEGYEIDISSVSIDAETEIDGSATGLSNLSCELFLQADSSIRIYFNAETIANYNASVSYTNIGGQEKNFELEIVEGVGCYYVEIPHIPANMLDTVYTLTIENTSDSSSTVIDISAESCMAAYLNSGSTAQQNVAKAMYLYGDAAKAYIG